LNEAALETAATRSNTTRLHEREIEMRGSRYDDGPSARRSGTAAKFLGHAALLGTLGSLALPVLADSSDAGTRSDVFQLGVVEVSIQAADEGVLFPGVERITSEEFRRHERWNATDAVNLLPGVMIENIGNRNERVVFIRGFDSRQVPLFVDGIPVYVPYNGSIDLGRFTTFDLAEIQVTKAFTSVLLGPNTLGGSINLVSRRPTSSLRGGRGCGRRLRRQLGTERLPAGGQPRQQPGLLVRAGRRLRGRSGSFPCLGRLRAGGRREWRTSQQLGLHGPEIQPQAGLDAQRH
jgi:outer membrane receptor protein involved in Fe transport